MQMNYRLEIFYQKNEGDPHEKIENNKLSNYIGLTLADSILCQVEYRMTHQTIPEVKAFFEHGGRQIISANLTNRGNVYIEAVEVECAMEDTE